MALRDFKVLTFDVVGTLIDFERGILEFVRRSTTGASALPDGAILDAYRRSRGNVAAGRFPEQATSSWR